MSVLQQNEKSNYLHSPFSQQDDEMWEKLYKKQSERLEEYATPTFLNNIKIVDLPCNRVTSLRIYLQHEQQQ